MSLGLGAGLAIASGAESVFGGLVNYGLQKDSQAFNAAEAQKSRDWEAEQAAITREFNSAEAQKSRDWNEYMASSSYQRSVADMKAAGINPASLGGNGASSPVGFGSSAVASAGMPSVRSAHSAMAHATIGGVSDAMYNAARLETLEKLSTSGKKSGYLQEYKELYRTAASIINDMQSIDKSPKGYKEALKSMDYEDRIF